MALNAEDPTASANWQLIREELDRLIGEGKRRNMPGLRRLAHVAYSLRNYTAPSTPAMKSKDVINDRRM
jgi:hypothetical protein